MLLFTTSMKKYLSLNKAGHLIVHGLVTVVVGCTFAIAAQAPQVIQLGSTVLMHYTLTVEGRVVDTSVGKVPLKYIQGAGQMIPGLENQMLGMKLGERKKVKVKPDQAYGSVNPNAYQVIPKKSVTNWKEIKVGAVLSGQKEGQDFQGHVVAIDKENITLDLNHPLAGKTLDFDIQVMTILPPASKTKK